MPNTGHVLDSKTLALWRLDDAQGLPATDAAGKYTLPASGTPVNVPNLIFDGARAKRFSSLNLYLSSGDATMRDALRGEFTIEAAINLDAYGTVNDTRIIDIQDASNRLIWFSINQSGRLQTFWQAAGVSKQYDEPSHTLALATSYHVAMRKVSLGGGNYRTDVFVNGVKVGSSGSFANTTGGIPTLIGLGSGIGGGPFTGIIDDVRISSVARTDAEIYDSWNRCFNNAQLSQSVAAPYSHTANRSMWTSLIRPIRDADQDQGRLLLQRFLARQEQLADATADKIRSLKDTDNFSKLPDEFVGYQAPQVGLTSDLADIIKNLSPTTHKRFASGAVALWKRRGTPRSIIEMLRLLTGRSVTYRDWFSYRNILGESTLADEQLGLDYYVIGGSVTAFDEMFSNVRMMDPGISPYPVNGHILDEKTLGLWRLDELSGNAIDALGNYNLVAVGAPAHAIGKISGARSTTIDVGFSSIFSPSPLHTAALTGNFTGEAWFYINPSINYPPTWPGAGNGHGALFALSAGNGTTFMFGVGSTGFFAYNITNGFTEVGSWAPYGTATWHHLAVRSTSLNATQARLDYFVDGVNIGQSTILKSVVVPTSPVIAIGGEGTAFNAFTGRIDDVRFSNVPRTDAEILESYQRGAAALADATLSQLVLDVVNLARPISERVEVILLDFFDTFDDASRARWTNIAGPSADASSKSLVLAPGCEEEAKITIASPGLIQDYIASHKFKLGNVGNTHQVKFSVGDDTAHYRLDVTKNQMVLNRVSSGAVVTPVARAPSSNLLKWSEQLNRSGGQWFPANISVTADATVGPDGAATADKLVESAAVAVEHYLEQYLNSDINATPPIDAADIACSIFAKAAERNWLFLAFVQKDNATVSGAWVDLTSGALGTVSGGIVAAIYPMGNGWYRCQIVGNAGTGSANPRLRVKFGTANNQPTFTGDGTSGLFAVGAQMQLNSSVGLYLPTTDTLVSQTPFLLAAGVEYGLRIHCSLIPGVSYTVKVYLDGSLVMEFRDPVAPSKAGSYRIANPGSSPGSNTVDNVELSRLPVRSAIVGPTGYTYTPNFLTG